MGQSSQVHIQQLFRAGIATHFVENNASLDPIFALSKVRDFPEVTFAAAFDDGMVILGCLDDLPTQLAGIAQPIMPNDPQPQDSIEVKLDALIARLESEASDDVPKAGIEEVLTAFKQQQKEIATLQNQISNIQSAVETTAQSITSTSADETAFATLQAQLEQLNASTRPAADHEHIAQQLSQIRADLAQVLSLTVGQTPLPLAELSEKSLSDLETRLSAQIAIVPTAPDLSQQAAEIAATQQTMEQALSTISNDIKSLIAMHGAAGTQDSIQSEISDLLAKLEDRPALTAMDAKLETVSATLRELSDTLPRSDADVLAQLSTQIAALTADVAAMSQRPTATVDQTEQRQTSARFLTAMGTVISRLETTVADVSAMGAETNNTGTVELHHKIDLLTNNLAPVCGLPPQLGDLKDALAPIPAQGDRILGQLAVLDARSDPAQTETAQRRGLAHFVQAIETIISRVEVAVDGVDKASQRIDFAPLLAQIETALATVATQQSQTDLLERMAMQSGDLGALRAELATLGDRPAPVLDLTAQRTSFAQFATALQTVLGRFENIATQIEQPAQEQTPEEAIAEPEQNPCGPSFSDSRVSLQKLRKDFAELIARQIMENTVQPAASPGDRPDRQN
ncbi:hypothetical protein [Yoonia algicola]|uniref:Uncharacterized protein n=1 Tax=Yoonia algicola TaxID=3137368 RepID=A0AAN0NJG2_9RHOB